MRIIYDFKCPDGHTTESLVNREDKTAKCKECGATAQRIISPIRSKLDPISGDFPGETIRWLNKREKQMKQEQRQIDNHGKVDW